jgi:hypothetical protein
MITLSIILFILTLTFFLAYKKEKKEHRITRKEVQYQRVRGDILEREVDELNRELSGGNDFRREEV